MNKYIDFLDMQIQKQFRKEKEACRDWNVPFKLAYKEYFDLCMAPCSGCGALADQNHPVMSGIEPVRLNTVIRSVNKRGFVLDNVLSLCILCAASKGTTPFEGWIEHCRRVANNPVVASVSCGFSLEELHNMAARAGAWKRAKTPRKDQS